MLKKFSLFLTQPYMGHTGYSTKENVNNIKIVHLHWGLQLIFDESQKEGNNEIWIDVYPLTRFLGLIKYQLQPPVQVHDLDIIHILFRTVPGVAHIGLCQVRTKNF